MSETIPAVFLRQAAARGEQPLFFAKRQGVYQPMTWRQAAETVDALSIYLLAQQVNVGDRVLLLSENRPEWGLADLAVQSVGAWTVPLYATLTDQDIQTIGRDCEPVLAIVSTSEQVAKLLAIARVLPSLRLIVVMDATQQHPAFVKTWAEALADGKEMSLKLRGLFEHRRDKIRPADTATVLYTSGTTGEPKGVMLSHHNLLSNVEACLRVIPVTEADLLLSFLPLSHVFERMAGFCLVLAAGASVAYAETMDTVAQDMRMVRPTVMLGVPRFFEKLYARIQEGLQHAPPLKRRLASWAVRVGQGVMMRRVAGEAVPLALAAQHWMARQLVFRRFAERLGGRLRFFVSGGAPLSKDIGEFFYRVGVIILEGYGLTETSPVITVNRLPLPRFGTVGPPVPGVEIRIATDGEILTRGPHVMQGYYHKPEETAAVVVEGWLHTGDIGSVDREGYLTITDRKKDLIKTAGGKFVAPQKLEQLFATDPYISQAFVFGDRQPYCVALIVPALEPLRRYAQEQEIVARSLHDLVREPQVIELYWRRIQERQQGLAPFEQVKRIALLDQEFSQATGELTPTLKAKRNVIAQRYASLLQDLYQTPAS